MFWDFCNTTRHLLLLRKFNDRLGRKRGRKMIATRKKNLKKLVCVAIVGLAVLPGAREARATLVDANAVEEGLEYYIRIDKGVYDLGEPIEILCRVTNVSEEILNVAELGIYSISLELTRPEGDTLFATYFGPPFPPMPPGLPDIISLNPGEYIETLWPITSDRWGTDGEWVEEPFSTVGQYSISSKYLTFILIGGPSSLVSGPLDFEIIPEPSSLILFVVGLPLANYIKRRIRD